MPLITIPPVEIEIDIPDLILGGLSLKRKARLFTLTYNQATKSLTLAWIVRYPDLQGVKGLSTYSKESIADNTVMVDVATGEILEPVITEVGTLDEEGNPVIDAEGNPLTHEETSYPGNYTGQYDWFNMVAETQAIEVHNMIRQYGLQADWSI